MAMLNQVILMAGPTLLELERHLILNSLDLTTADQYHYMRLLNFSVDLLSLTVFTEDVQKSFGGTDMSWLKEHFQEWALVLRNGLPGSAYISLRFQERVADDLIFTVTGLTKLPESQSQWS